MKKQLGRNLISVPFDKDTARKNVLEQYPELVALPVEILKERLRVQKQKNERLIIKSRLIQELLISIDLRSKLANELKDVVEKNYKALRKEYDNFRTKDYYHRIMKNRPDFKAIIRERNRLFLLKKKALTNNQSK